MRREPQGRLRGWERGRESKGGAQQGDPGPPGGEAAAGGGAR